MALQSLSISDLIKTNENWLRLSTFQHGPLKDALLHVFHNGYHPIGNDPTFTGLPINPVDLYNEFDKQRSKLGRLKKNRVLRQEQIDALLPASQQTDSSKLDVTLIVLVMKNFIALPPQLKQAVNDGREWRNFLHHTEPDDVNLNVFNQRWVEGERIILALGFQYDTNKLKVEPLDAKQQLTIASLHARIAKMQSKCTTLITEKQTLQREKQTLQTEKLTLQTEKQTLQKEKQTLQTEKQSLETDKDTVQTENVAYLQLISNLKNQLQLIEAEVQQIKESSSISVGEVCVVEALTMISSNLNTEETKDLIRRLKLQFNDDNLVECLKTTPWRLIKSALEVMNRVDIVQMIKQETLITEGLRNASIKLHEQYKEEFIQLLVDEPLSARDNYYVQREDIYVDLVVLPASDIDREISNSDRSTLMRQAYLKKASTEKAVDKIIKPDNEVTFIRGVAGTGKTSLLDMFILQWAKEQLDIPFTPKFLFKFTCRDLNQYVSQFATLEELLLLKYPEVFNTISLDVLSEVSDRVLVIIDGVDELDSVYSMDGSDSPSSSQSLFLKIIYELMNPNSANSLKNHQTIVCGRPKACEYVKKKLSKHGLKSSTIEVCGFNDVNVEKYIRNFFKTDQEKGEKVIAMISKSYSLQVMSSVPIFLWVICYVYIDDYAPMSINSNTELYLYTCLIFLHRHSQGLKEYESLEDIVKDEDMISVIFSLMELSVKTYMNNQVIFTEEEIKNLNCPIHLEQTGFVVKCRLNSLMAAIYQFRHLILQEFLCGLYIFITKDVSQFKLNKELSSCYPTIFGIFKISQDNKHHLFVSLLTSLKSLYERKTNFIAKLLSTSFGKFERYLIKNALTFPESMMDDKTLSITDDPGCREFLDSFKELKHIVDVPLFDDVEVELRFYKDFKNVLDLLENVGAKRITKLSICCKSIFKELYYEHFVRLIGMAVDEQTNETYINLNSSDYNDDSIFCENGNLLLNLYQLQTIDVINRILSLLEKVDVRKIKKLNISFEKEFNVDDCQYLAQLIAITVGEQTNAYITLRPSNNNNWISFQGEKLLLNLYQPHPNNPNNSIKMICHLLENVGKISQLDIDCETSIYEYDFEDLIQLIGMAVNEQTSASIILNSSYGENDNVFSKNGILELNLFQPLPDDVIKRVLNLLELFGIRKIKKLDINCKKVFDELSYEYLHQLIIMVVDEHTSASILLHSSNGENDHVSCENGVLDFKFFLPQPDFFIERILNLLETIGVKNIKILDIHCQNIFDKFNHDYLHQLIMMAINEQTSASIFLYSSEWERDNVFSKNGILELKFCEPQLDFVFERILNLLETIGVKKIKNLDINCENPFGGFDYERNTLLYQRYTTRLIKLNMIIC